MKYSIKTIRKVGSRNFISISKEKYNKIHNARNSLFEVLNIEEKFDILLGNYKEFEQELLNKALDYALYSVLNWSSSKGDIHNIDRKIINLLSACKLYLDSVRQNIKEIYENNTEIIDNFEEKTHEEYDNYLGYRVLEALRNYAQHNGLPTHHLRYSGHRVDLNDENHRIKYVIIPSLRITDLEKDSKFKKEVLNELKNIGETIDIRPLVRQYLESLGRIHNYIRNQLESDVIQWDSIINKVIRSYSEKFDDILDLSIQKLDDTGKTNDRISIFDEMIERRKELENKNRFITSFTKNIITNEIG
jgi:hypothetical protein